MDCLPLIWGDDLDAPLAWRAGQAISRRQYLADVHALADNMPTGEEVLNLSADRYLFAVGLGAAMLRGQSNLMPPNHTPQTVANLRRLFPSVYGLVDEGTTGFELPMFPHVGHAATAPSGAVHAPSISADAVTAQVAWDAPAQKARVTWNDAALPV